MIEIALEAFALIREYLFWDITSLSFAISLMFFVVAVLIWRLTFDRWPRRTAIEIYIQCLSMGFGVVLALATFFKDLAAMLPDARTYFPLAAGAIFFSAYCGLTSLRPLPKEGSAPALPPCAPEPPPCAPAD